MFGGYKTAKKKSKTDVSLKSDKKPIKKKQILIKDVTLTTVVKEEPVKPVMKEENIRSGSTVTSTYPYSQELSDRTEEILAVIPKGVVFNILSSLEKERVKVRSDSSPFLEGFIKIKDLKIL